MSVLRVGAGVQVLSNEAVTQAEVEIALLEQKARDNGHLSKKDRELLEAFQRSKAGFEKAMALARKSSKPITVLPEFILACMDAYCSVPGQINTVPKSIGDLLAEFLRLAESYGIHVMPGMMFWHPSKMNPKRGVERMLAEEPAPERPPSPTVILRGRQPRTIYASAAWVASMLDRWPDRTIIRDEAPGASDPDITG